MSLEDEIRLLRRSQPEIGRILYIATILFSSGLGVSFLEGIGADLDCYSLGIQDIAGLRFSSEIQVELGLWTKAYPCR